MSRLWAFWFGVTAGSAGRYWAQKTGEEWVAVWLIGLLVAPLVVIIGRLLWRGLQAEFSAKEKAPCPTR